VSVTAVPLAKLALHAVPQLMPAGLLVTVPLPDSVTVRTGCVALKIAVTEAFADNVREQDALPLHAPDHPAKVEPVPGVAVRVTTDPLLKLALHVVPQLIPAGLLVTVPLPVPASVTLKTGCAAAPLNVAVTEVLADNVITHDPVPLQAPDHPANVDPAAGVAVRVTCVPDEKLAVQVDPQLIPPGLLLTVPVPLPAALTISWIDVGAVELLAPPPQLQVKQTAVKVPATTIKPCRDMVLPIHL
jgi:hypothetical protein